MAFTIGVIFDSLQVAFLNRYVLAGLLAGGSRLGNLHRDYCDSAIFGQSKRTTDPRRNTD
ncbi:hypothetical protein ASG11_10280 [Sphingomonas sp. Leaf357]|nr:hypothetical protein ASG11_10280 [Sphingomonas sp. Leaf357]